ncbi:MAG: DNA-protecting protein DprA [Oscillospiraceae bacterium]|nr:DNA-protecting protein DprA [Oscillospiraceae bacterium]
MKSKTKTKINTKPYYVWLLSVMGAANPRSLRLLAHFGNVKAVYDAVCDNPGALKPHELKSFNRSSLDKANELIDWCGKHGYGIVTIDEPEYPESLRHIYNPPIVLFTEGDIAGIGDGIRINVIGTRNPAAYSSRIAAYICGELSGVGFTIISGMAVGLDKCSMTAALERGGRVAGVLACGIDVEYPRGSKGFRAAVVESGGVCLSELMPRDSVRPAYFQERNRIMSGLSSGTLIVEAGERSGCHITALHTINQNRDLFCIPPHDILDSRYSGVMRYLRDGAIPVFSHIDIVNEYLSDVSRRLSEHDTFSATPRVLEKPAAPTKPTKSGKTAKSAKGESSESIVFKTVQPIPQQPPQADYSALPENHAAIVEALRQAETMTFDDIIKAELCGTEDAYEVLLDMELDGLIEKIAGSRYKIV